MVTIAALVAATCTLAGSTAALAAHQSEAKKKPPLPALLLKLRKAGAVNVGVVNQPPYSNVQPDGSITGIAPALVTTIMKQFGVPKIKGHVATYGDAIPGLLAGRWDIIASALYINPTRCEAMIFSDPILADPDAFAVKPGNPLGLRTLKDVATKKARLGILTGAQEITVAQHAGVSADQITTYSDQLSLFADLKAGRIDAIMNAKSAYRAMPAAPNEWVVTPSIPDGIVASAGIGFRKSDKALRDLFNVKLRALKKSGKFAKISRQFGFDPASAEEASTAEACASLFPKPKTKKP